MKPTLNWVAQRSRTHEDRHEVVSVEVEAILDLQGAFMSDMYFV